MIECIAPAGPGGGWDRACRTAARALAELNNMQQAKNVIEQGLKLASDKEDKDMLQDTLADLEQPVVGL